jgi:hypothetical protein
VTKAGEEAASAVDEACPRCGTRREPDQEYCLECGFELPPVSGGVASLRRGWLKRIGWYPGDWVWISLLTLLVAAAGAAVAIAATSGGGPGGSTVVSPPPVVAPTTTQAVTTTTTPRHRAGQGTRTTTTTTTTTSGHRAGQRTTTTTTAAPPTVPNGKLTWPAGEDGWTNVLISYPASGGLAVPAAAALRAAHRGLPQVGVLDSSDFASLHPGYTVVFSGIYATSAEADAAVATAHANGFPGAYPRQISR